MVPSRTRRSRHVARPRAAIRSSARSSRAISSRAARTTARDGAATGPRAGACAAAAAAMRRRCSRYCSTSPGARPRTASDHGSVVVTLRADPFPAGADTVRVRLRLATPRRAPANARGTRDACASAATTPAAPVASSATAITGPGRAVDAASTCLSTGEHVGTRLPTSRPQTAVASRLRDNYPILQGNQPVRRWCVARHRYDRGLPTSVSRNTPLQGTN